MLLTDFFVYLTFDQNTNFILKCRINEKYQKVSAHKKFYEWKFATKATKSGEVIKKLKNIKTAKRQQNVSDSENSECELSQKSAW